MDIKIWIEGMTKGDEKAYQNLYEQYKEPFYFIALSVLQNDDAALAVAAEAFRRIRADSYRFDEQLNAEYWIMDVLYTLCFNKASRRTSAPAGSGRALPEILKQEPEVFIHAYTDLSQSEIAVLLEKKKAAVSKAVSETSGSLQDLKSAAQKNCPDYLERLISEGPTGLEDLPDQERYQSEQQVRKHKRLSSYKRILAIILGVVFLAGAALIITDLVRKNYGGDINQNLLGEGIQLQSNNQIAMTELNGILYFRGISNEFYKRDMETGTVERISEDYPKELLNDGAYIYYRNYHDGYLYRVNPDGSGRTRLCDAPGSTMELYKGYLYFSTTNGLYRIPSSGASFEEAELILDTSKDANLFCVDLEVDQSGNVYFASGVGRGVHHVTDYNGEPSVDGIFSEEAYTVQIDGDLLYFDYKEASGKIVLYSLDLKAYLSAEAGERVRPALVTAADGTKLELSTGAFYAYNGSIYYAGISEGKSALLRLDASRNISEIAKLDTNSVSAESLFITDIYITDHWAYCFCSDGKSKGKRIFFAQNFDQDKTVTIYES